MAGKKPRTFGAPTGTPDESADYSRGRPQVGPNKQQLRKAMAEPTKASTPYKSSSPSPRSSSTPRATSSNIPMGGMLGAAKRAVNSRGRNQRVDDAVDAAVTGEKKK